jgi:outer membrane protein
VQPSTKRGPFARLLAALLLIASLGCETVHRARVAQDFASAGPGERTPTAAELGLPTEGPLALDVALKKALEVHPSIIAARQNVVAAEARVRETEASLLPQLSTSAAASYRDGRAFSSSAGAVDHRFYSYGFDVSWLLFDFGRTRAQARNLAELWLAAQADLKTAELDVALNVRTAYFDLSRQIELLAVAQQTVRQFEAHLEQVHGFVEVGTRIPYDETKAQVDLGNARLLEVKARDAMLAAKSTLAGTLGLAEVVDWTPAPDAPLPDVPEDFDAAWALAQTMQPTLAAARARELAASALIDARIASLYPSLDLSASYSAGGSTWPLAWSWLIGPAIQWVPFDGFQRLATIDEAVASLRIARSARAQIEQTTWLDVRRAWLAIRDARERIDLTALTEQNAVQNLELAKGLFEVGKGTSIELADAEQALTQASAERVQARADEQTAVAQLARAIGIAIEGE